MANGIVLHQGPSLLDGKPIISVAVGLTRGSYNGKTVSGVILTFIPADNGQRSFQTLWFEAEEYICGGFRRSGLLAQRRFLLEERRASVAGCLPGRPMWCLSRLSSCSCSQGDCSDSARTGLPGAVW
jgi:hypothetical protein